MGLYDYINIHTYIHITHILSEKEWQRHLRYSTFTPRYQNYFTMRNTADVTSGKPIADRSQSISGVSSMDRSLPFTTSTAEREREKILLFCPGHHTILTIS
jgi:hypothetical protein